MGNYSQAAKHVKLAALAAVATHVQLHTGSPGAAGTSNVATSTGATRQALSWGSPSGGQVITSAGFSWSVVAGTYTHISFWDAPTGGTFLGSDDLPVAQVYAGPGILPVASLTLDDNATADAS